MHDFKKYISSYKLPVLPVNWVVSVRIVIKILWEYTLVRELAPNGEGISHCRPLGLPVKSYDLAKVVN